MARFILLDNWLRDAGGHNYQYALDILRAAEGAGLQPVLVTHKDFVPKPESLPSSWLVEPRFQFGWAARHCAAVDGASRHPIDLDGRRLPIERPSLTNKLIQRLSNSLDFRLSDRRRRIDDYVHVCNRLFAKLGFDPATRVLAPNVSDFEFIALARFLRAQPRSQLLDWHLQFHFDIAHSRKPNQESQHHRIRLLRRQFRNALMQLPHHRIHFYATTEQLAVQYNLLRTKPFSTLPYPVSDDLIGAACERRATDARSDSARLRVTFGGAVRREKGQQRFKHLMRKISEGVSKDHVQMWVQGSAESLAGVLPNRVQDRIVFGKVTQTRDEPVVAVRHPLDRTDYVELIRRSDVGVFPYDGSRYHARCSGILIEMLSAGVPVIVPAGCWLSEQISEPIYQHLDKLSTTAPVVRRTRSDELAWQAGNSTKKLKGKATITIAGGSNAKLQTNIPERADELLFSFTWCNFELGDYLRIELEQFDATGRTLVRPWTEILAPRRKSLPASAKFRLHPEASALRLNCGNAYHSNALGIRHPELRFLAQADAGTPAGAVGLIAGEWRQIPELLDEIVRHYPHYRNSAVAFSTDWNERRAAMQTVEAISANCRPRPEHALPKAA